MTFARAKPAGWTNDTTTITADQINQIDIDHANALDMVGGGSYALGGDITITGSKKWTWDSTGHFTFNRSVYVASRSVTRVAAGTPLFRIAEWDFGTNGVMASISTSGAEFNWPLDLPHGQVLTEVKAYLAPAGGHGGNVATPPKVILEYHTPSTATTADLGTTTDPGVLPAYEVAHTLAVSGLTHTIDRSLNRYFLKIFAEAGANAAANLLILGVEFTFTRTTIGED